MVVVFSYSAPVRPPLNLTSVTARAATSLAGHGLGYCRAMSDAPVPGPESALPSVRARVAAFVAIFLGGAGGAVIGGSFTALQCDGSCSTWIGLGVWVGSLIGAVGVAVIAVLSLRALGEWNAMRRSTGQTLVQP
jgi:hypothetical protein